MLTMNIDSQRAVLVETGGAHLILQWVKYPC